MKRANLLVFLLVLWTGLAPAAVSTDRVDGISSSVAVKAPVKAATTANITLSGLQTIDGVSVVAGDRVLVKSQTTASANGIYTVGSTAWSRSADFDGNRDVVKGTLILVTDGTVNGNTYWRITTDNPITIGTTSIAFGAGAGSDSASVGFLQSGTGAVSRTVQSRLRDTVHAADFGALCDAVTNDTAAIQAAITYAVTLLNGAEVRLPRGVCMIPGGLDWPKDVPVNITGEGMWTTFLLQKNGTNTNGALRVNGGKGTDIDGGGAGTIYHQAGPTGSLSNFMIASDSGPALSFLDASNVNISHVYGVFAHASYAILDANGGFENYVVNSRFGEPDSHLPAAVLALIASRPVEKYAIQIEPRTHTVEGTALTSISTEWQFVNVRIGTQIGATAGVRIANPDVATYSAFGFTFTNVKFDCITGTVALDIANADVFLTSTIIEATNAAQTCVQTIGGVLNIANSDIGGVLRTARGANNISLRMTGGHLTSLNVDTTAIDRLQFRGVNMDVDPQSVNAGFGLTAVGTKDYVWDVVVYTAGAPDPLSSRMDNISDSGFYGLRLLGGTTYNPSPMIELNQTKSTGGYTASRIQARVASNGFFEVYDRTNSLQVLSTPFGQHGGSSANKGDAAAALTVGLSERTSFWNTALTADRAVTLSTTNAYAGARFHIVRTAAATGASNLNVGTGPLKALAVGTWCIVEYNGSAWVLIAYGAL